MPSNENDSETLTDLEKLQKQLTASQEANAALVLEYHGLATILLEVTNESLATVRKAKDAYLHYVKIMTAHTADATAEG